MTINDQGRKDEIAAQPSAARNDGPQIVIAVVLAVVVGFGVSFAIEYSAGVSAFEGF